MADTQTATEDKTVRIAVLDLEGNLLGYKLDTMWTLGKPRERGKEHDLKGASPDGRLAQNTLQAYPGFASSDSNDPLYKDSWFAKFPDGVILSIEDASSVETLGQELMRYRVIRTFQSTEKTDRYEISTD